MRSAGWDPSPGAPAGPSLPRPGTRRRVGGDRSMAGWRCRSGFWDENEGRHTRLARLDRVCDLLAYHVTPRSVCSTRRASRGGAVSGTVPNSCRRRALSEPFSPCGESPRVDQCKGTAIAARPLPKIRRLSRRVMFMPSVRILIHHKIAERLGPVYVPKFAGVRLRNTELL